MTRDEIVDVTRRWFEQVWNQRNDAAIDEMMAIDCWIDGFDPSGERVVGRDAFKRGRLEYLAMFPDLHVEVDHVAVDGNQAIAWLKCMGTCDPRSIGQSGDPKPVTFHAVTWAEMENGMFQGGRNLVDFGAVMRAFLPTP